MVKMQLILRLKTFKEWSDQRKRPVSTLPFALKSSWVTTDGVDVRTSLCQRCLEKQHMSDTFSASPPEREVMQR